MALLVFLVLGVFPIAVESTGATEPSSADRILIAGVVTERQLAAGESEAFEVSLAIGTHWRIAVKQLGIDVVVEVRDPGGQSVLAVDSPLGREGTEVLLLTPEATGLFEVEVRCEKKGAPEGHFEIGLESLPATLAEDRLRLRAERAVTEAGRHFSRQLVRQEDGKNRALDKLQEAFETFHRLGDRHREAEVLLLLGAFQGDLGDYKSAVASYDEALLRVRQLEDLEAEAAALHRLGLARISAGESSVAIGELERALALRQRLGNPEREAATRSHLCLALQRQGNFRQAGACYETTLTAARELGDQELEARVLNNLGGIYQNLGEPAKTIEHFRQALVLQRKLGDDRGVGTAYNNLGFYFHQLGDVEEALLHYGPALEIFEQQGNRYWEARTLNNFGFTYLALGEAQRARSFLLRALPLRRAVGDRSGEAVTLRNLGRASSDLGQGAEAARYFTEALAVSTDLGDERGAATARLLLGESLLEQRRLAAARRELELAIASLRPMGKRLEEAEALELLARVHRSLGDARRSVALGEQARGLHRAVRNPVGEVAALSTLAGAERDLGNPTAARRHLEEALEICEALQGKLGNPSQRGTFLASQRGVYERYVDLLMELHDASPGDGYAHRALEASERARSRSLLGLLRPLPSGSSEGTAAAARPLAVRLRSAEQRFAAKSLRHVQLVGRNPSGKEVLEAEQELYEALTDLDLLRAELRRRSPLHSSLETGEVAAAAQISELLDDDTVLLEILLGEKRSFLWWVDREGVAAYELPPRQDVEKLAQEVYESVSEVHQGKVSSRQSLAALGRMLLGPVAGKLLGQRLVVVADGALHLVPFAALTLPTAPGEPVIAHHEVVSLASASVLAQQRRQQRPRQAGRWSPPTTVAVLADPIFSRKDPRLTGIPASEPSRNPSARGASELRLDELGRLPHTLEEAEVIAAQVPAEGLLLALGADARRSRLLSNELATYGILHFATHGFINPRLPELSGLMLSQVDAAGNAINGFVGLHDVANLELAARLVVLSGCRTALGKEIRGEGVVGLTRGFLYAGVPRVVASFWQVRDRATAELMARFYQGLMVEGLTPGAALRAAQLSLRQQRRWRDPYFWAAFSLQGEWR